MNFFKDFNETKITLEIYQFKANVMLQYFRACIWWKYLDEHSVLPPPYTAFYFMIMGAQYLSHSIALIDEETPVGLLLELYLLAIRNSKGRR